MKSHVEWALPIISLGRPLDLIDLLTIDILRFEISRDFPFGCT